MRTHFQPVKLINVSFSHHLFLVGLRSSSSESTDYVVPLRGGEIEPFSATLAQDNWQSVFSQAKSLEILRHGWDLNPGHREDRQWDAFILPLSYHDWLINTSVKWLRALFKWTGIYDAHRDSTTSWNLSCCWTNDLIWGSSWFITSTPVPDRWLCRLTNLASLTQLSAWRRHWPCNTQSFLIASKYQ